jgi:hypothetical protein
MLGLGLFIISLILYTVGRTLWTGNQPVARPLPTHRTTQTQNKRTQTSMPRVGFEHTCLRPHGHCDQHRDEVTLTYIVAVPVLSPETGSV